MNDSDGKTFVVRFDTDNAAFTEDGDAEVARILRRIADRVEAGEDVSHYQTIHDANGNDVGRYAWKRTELL